LSGRVEGEVVSVREEEFEVLVLEGRGVGVDLSLEELTSEEGLMQAACGGASEVLADEGRLAGLGETL
jgi:hypothetical protein